MDDPTLTGLFAYDSNTIPRSLTVVDSRMDGGTLYLTWQPPISSDSIIGYRIYRSFNYEQYLQPIGTTIGLTWIDSGLQPKKSYYYRVVSVY